MYTVAPAMISDVIIDLDSVNIDDNDISFTLSWNEPFAGINPIVNYTVTINCTNDATCPVVVNTDNVTRTADVNFITDLLMMTTLSVTATNSIGTSDPAIRIITGKLHIFCAYVSVNTYTKYRKRGKIRWAKLLHFLRFSRVPQKFSHEYIFILYKLHIIVLFKCCKR